MSMIPDDRGIDDINKWCENAAQLRSSWVTIYVQKPVIFVLHARGLIIELSLASPYYVCRSLSRFQRAFPRQNRMKRREARGAHLPIHDSRLSGGGFLTRYEEPKKYTRRENR